MRSTPRRRQHASPFRFALQTAHHRTGMPAMPSRSQLCKHYRASTGLCRSAIPTGGSANYGDSGYGSNDLAAAATLGGNRRSPAAPAAINYTSISPSINGGRGGSTPLPSAAPQPAVSPSTRGGGGHDSVTIRRRPDTKSNGTISVTHRRTSIDLVSRRNSATSEVRPSI